MALPNRLTPKIAPALALAVVLVCGTGAHADIFSVSPEKERRLGQQAAREIERGLPIVSGPVADWVQRVGARLVAHSNSEFQYSFHVVDSPEINAFCLPGGHIYIYTGMRKVVKTDDELAAVLAHEITHAEEHHYARQSSKNSKRGALLGLGTLLLGLPPLASQAVGLLDFGLTQNYSREHEYDADRIGLERMTRAGYNPAAMVNVLQRLAEDENRDGLDRWFASHPEGKKRVAVISRLIPSPNPAGPLK